MRISSLKKRIVFQHFLYVFYFVLLRTMLGLKQIDVFARQHDQLLRVTSFVSVFLGFAGMIFISFDIIKGLFGILSANAAPTVGLVLPFDVKGAFYVPFVYWLISIIVVMLVHEFSHGIFARLYKVRVKSTGLACAGAVIPIIPGAFVDIDEKQLIKKSVFEQLSVFAAGPFANMVFAALFFVALLSLIPAVDFFYQPNGIKITEVVKNSPAETAGLFVGEVIKTIDRKDIRTSNDFSAAFETKSAGSEMLVNNKKTVLASNNNAAFLGVVVEQEYVQTKQTFIAPIIKWLKELVFWIFALNLGVGLFNLLPLGPLDGGRMMHTVLCRFFTKKHVHKVMTTMSTFLLVVLGTTIVHSFW